MTGFLLLLFGASLFLVSGMILPVVAVSAVLEFRDALRRWRARHAMTVALRSTDRVLAAGVALVGGYYCFRALVTLFNLPGVTGQWIAMSGDPDFRLDYGLFLLAIGIGAAVVLFFGVASAAAGMVTALGQCTCLWHMKMLTLAAPIVHGVWFMYRVIGSGLKSDAAFTLWMFALRGAVICAAFITLWLITRRPPVVASPA